jgi:formamidopyrimidine-DNA glycosylase
VPELPEVEALAAYLTAKTADRTIVRADLGAISALKTFDPPLDALVGARILGCGRRGKFLLLGVEPVAGERRTVAMHLARGGWVHWRASTPPNRLRPGRGPLAVRIGLDDGSGFDVTEAGTEKRLAVWIVRDPDDVEAIARLGPDPLDPIFDVAALAGLLVDRRAQIKGVLTDQAVIAGVGNAYSDEALHTARLSPFKTASSLTGDEVARLHGALVEVLTLAVSRSADVPADGLKREKKTGLRVHGRTGQPCPVCGDIVREVAFASKSLQYCPTCQTGGKPLADRRLSRLLK